MLFWTKIHHYWLFYLKNRRIIISSTLYGLTWNFMHDCDSILIQHVSHCYTHLLLCWPRRVPLVDCLHKESPFPFQNFSILYNKILNNKREIVAVWLNTMKVGDKRKKFTKFYISVLNCLLCVTNYYIIVVYTE